MTKNVIQGAGFENGGFAEIIINGTYHTPDYVARAANAHDALVAALTLAEDVLSRSPYSTSMWPDGLHPQIGITQIRDALELATKP